MTSRSYLVFSLQNCSNPQCRRNLFRNKSDFGVIHANTLQPICSFHQCKLEFRPKCANRTLLHHAPRFDVCSSSLVTPFFEFCHRYFFFFFSSAFLLHHLCVSCVSTTFSSEFRRIINFNAEISKSIISFKKKNIVVASYELFSQRRPKSPEH